MPEFITLADGSLAVKGRNLLANTAGVSLEHSGDTAGQSHMSDRIWTIQKQSEFGGNWLTCSAQVDIDNAVANSESGAHRIGFELVTFNKEGAVDQYLDCWLNLSAGNDPVTYHGRIYQTFQTHANLQEAAAPGRFYIQRLIADSAKISNVKLEFGTEATPYSPAPEDEEAV